MEGGLHLPTPTKDQLDLGACVGVTDAMAGEIIDGTGRRFSALGCYRTVRLGSGFPQTQDTGAYPEAGLRALQREGFGSEGIWPYDVSKFAQTPPQAYLDQARDHPVTRWWRAQTVAEARSALSQGYPVQVAFDVPPNWGNTGRDGEWNDNGKPGVGGHSILMVGAYDSLEKFYCLNWWNVGRWGLAPPWQPEQGRCGCWLPYSEFPPGRRVMDAIVISDYDELAGG